MYFHYQSVVYEPKYKKYAPVKPSNYSEACKIDPQCSDGCDVCCNLPYNVKTGQIKVHQSLAERHEFWLADKRLEVKLEEGMLILYVGTNVHGSDGVEFMKNCPKCHLHMFEPVPQFYNPLMEEWNKMILNSSWSVEGHLYGLGDSDR